MKYLLSIIFLAAGSLAFGAIEFSEELDQFADTTAVESTETETDADTPTSADVESPTIRSAGNATASNAAVTSAQSTGIVGSMNGPLGTSSASTLGAASMLGGGGGASNQSGDEAEGTDDLLAEAEGQRGGDTSSLMVDPPGTEVMAMPEPSTVIVWGVLAVCGFGIYRKRS